MAAGASLVMPRTIVRENGWYPTSRNTRGLEYMFDRQHSLVPTTIYELCAVSGILNTLSVPSPYYLATLVKEVPKSSPDEWRELFYGWVAQYRPVEGTGPIIVKLGQSYLQYSITTMMKNLQLNSARPSSLGKRWYHCDRSIDRVF
jgi:hypothetical protein